MVLIEYCIVVGSLCTVQTVSYCFCFLPHWKYETLTHSTLQCLFYRDTNRYRTDCAELKQELRYFTGTIIFDWRLSRPRHYHNFSLSNYLTQGFSLSPYGSRCHKTGLNPNQFLPSLNKEEMDSLVERIGRVLTLENHLLQTQTCSYGPNASI